MSWIDKLARTYELNNGSPGLVPPFHVGKVSHVIVTLDPSSSFVDARLLLDKKEQEKIIPCTVDSQSRTSGLCPHPLFDTLQYIAGDLEDCFIPSSGIKVDKEKLHDAFELYINQLRGWCEAKQNRLVGIVYQYLTKKCLAGDLVRKGILPADECGRVFLEAPSSSFSSEYPIYKVVTGGDLSKAFILFEISDAGDDGTTVRLWEDKSVRDSWQSYYMDMLLADPESLKGFCQVTGKDTILAKMHPKQICNSADNSKIISSNDDQGFTYRGRFEEPMQACGIGLEVSQKAHAALRWLLAKQGMHEGSMYLVTWAVDDNPKIPKPNVNTFELYCDEEMEEDFIPPDTAEAAAHALNKLINGYSARLNATGLCLIVLDAATCGCLAIKTFRDLEESIYFANIRKWHTECAWLQFCGKDKKSGKEIRFYGAPSPRDIAKAACGPMKEDDSRIKSIVSRLLPCIIDGTRVPRDILDAVVRRASHFESAEYTAFRRNLSIACALYRYNNPINPEGGSYKMSLDQNLKSRDYLYGRLLAIADYLEKSAMSDSEQSRPTNAMRLMACFSEHPYSTWRNLYNQLNPYRVRLASNNPGLSVILEKLMSEVINLFSQEDYSSNRPLSGEYLLGFYCQKQSFYTKKTSSTEVVDNKEESEQE